MKYHLARMCGWDIVACERVKEDISSELRKHLEQFKEIHKLKKAKEDELRFSNQNVLCEDEDEPNQE